MPNAGGNINILWNEAAPGDTDNAGAGAGVIRSLETSLRYGLGQEHNWPAASGAAGIHLLGSARAFFDLQSNLSSSGTDGRLMVTSDTSELFHVGSNTTPMFLGGSKVISSNYASTWTDGHIYKWIFLSGNQAYNTGGGTGMVGNWAGSGFSTIPECTASAFTTQNVPLYVTLTGISLTTFGVTVFNAAGVDVGLNVFTSCCTVFVHAFGRALA